MMRYTSLCTLVVVLLVGGGGPLGSVAIAQVSSVSSDTVRVTVTEAIVRSLEMSPEVDQRRAQRQFASARREEARANRFLKDLSLNTSHSFAPDVTEFQDGSSDVPEDLRYLHPSRQNDWSIGALRPFSRFEIVARQPLYTWGELSGNIEAAKHGVAVERARIDQKALEVSARTGELYYNLLLTKALERLADRTGEVIERAKGEINRLLKEGDDSVDEADRFQTRLTEEEYKRRVVEIAQNQATARSALRRQLFLPDGTTVVPAEEELQPLSFSVHPDSLDYYLKRAMQHRPELKQAEAGVKARRALVDVAQSDYYPKIGIQASLSQSVTLPERPNPDNAYVGDSFMGTGTRTGIGIRQSLNFGQTEARVDQAKAELSKVKNQRIAARQLVRFEVEEAYRKLLIAKTDLQSRQRSTTIAGEWLRTEQVNFDLGFADTENLVKAVRADLEARARYLEAVKRYNVAVLRLLRTTGTLADRARAGTLLDTTKTQD